MLIFLSPLSLSSVRGQGLGGVRINPQSIENQLQETLQSRMTTVQIKEPCPKPQAAAVGTGQTDKTTQSYIVTSISNPHWSHSETSNIIAHANLLMMLQSPDKIKIYKGKNQTYLPFFGVGGGALETVSLYSPG